VPAVVTEMLPIVREVSLDVRVLLFTTGVAIATSILFAIIPLLALERRTPGAALQEEGTRTTPGTRRHRLQAGLVVSTVVLSFVLLVGAGLSAQSQRRDAFVGSRDHASIRYSTADTTDAAASLNTRLRAGTATLKFEPVHGYLRSLLTALAVPPESQALVFSQTSFQAPHINFVIFARGMLVHAYTRMYFADEPANATDPRSETSMSPAS